MPTPTILGIPLDENSSYLRGAAQAPPLIRRALHSESSNHWTETGVDLGAQGVLNDAGDVTFKSGEPAFTEIEDGILRILERRQRPISLGGDHSITLPIMRAISHRYPQVTIVHFDAHPDLYHDFQGNPHSHACPFARIMEEKLAGQLVQIGIRTLNGHQREQAQKFGVVQHEMSKLPAAEKLHFDGPVYISFDMDALDPAAAPGVSHHEPGGLTTRQAIDMLHGIAGEIVGADIVEFNPTRDVGGITGMVAAKILKEIAGIMISPMQ
jgi:agmatinase